MITPLGRHLLVALKQTAAKTTGGVALPASVQKESDYAMAEGIITHMGGDAFKPDGLNEFPEKPQVGDRVIFRSYSGIKLPLGDRQHRLMLDSDVKAILSPDTVIGKE